MKTWEEKVREEATEWAERFNTIGMASPEMDKFLDELMVYWMNESNEWCEMFIQKAKHEKVCFWIDHLVHLLINGN